MRSTALKSCGCAPARRRGFTLAEALISAIILAIVSASATLPFIAGTQQIQASGRLEQATALGQALMEEILARPFLAPGDPDTTPGPEADESSRDEFKNKDDFDGLTESSGALKNFENALITDKDSSGLWRTATVHYVTFPDQAATDVNSFVHIQVKVYDGNDPIVTLDRIASREN